MPKKTTTTTTTAAAITKKNDRIEAKQHIDIEQNRTVSGQ